MRILQVAPRFSTEYGGGGVVITRNLANGLAKRGHTVHIWTSDFEFDDDYALGGIHEAVKIGVWESKLNIASLHITPDMVWNAGKLIPEFNVIHMQGCRTFQNIVVRYYAKKYGVPYIVDAHGFPVEGTRLRRLFIRLFDVVFGNRIVKDATFCISESQIGVSEYKRAGVDESKIVVIASSYDLSVFDSLPERGQFKKKNGLDGKKVVLFLGGLDYIKGLDFLVKSFARLNRKDAVLVLVGADWGHEKTLRTMVEDLDIESKVLFTGYLGGTDKLEALVDAEVAVFPSRAEQGLPFAALEAIMCNVPVIVTDGTGAAEDIRRMGCGYVIDFGDVEQLEFMIGWLLIHSEFRSATVKVAQAYIKKNLSMTEKVKDYEVLYRRCIE